MRRSRDLRWPVSAREARRWLALAFGTLALLVVSLRAAPANAHAALTRPLVGHELGKQEVTRGDRHETDQARVPSGVRIESIRTPREGRGSSTALSPAVPVAWRARCAPRPTQPGYFAIPFATSPSRARALLMVFLN